MIFTTKNAGNVRLEWDGYEMTVWTLDNQPEKIGQFTFHIYEDFDGQECALVTGMHLEGPNSSRSYTKQGIGREILKYVVKHAGLWPVFTVNDGIRRDNGSHLTEMGTGFAARMIEDGLASWA